LFTAVAIIGGNTAIFAPGKARCIGILTHLDDDDQFTCVSLPEGLYTTESSLVLFGDVVVRSDNSAVFAPYDATCIAILSNDQTIACISIIGIATPDMFSNAVVLADNTVIFAPARANCVGVLSPTNQFSCIQMQSDYLDVPDVYEIFSEAVVIDQNTVVFPPRAANCVGFFYVAQGEFECKPFLPGRLDPAITAQFATAVLLNDGTALFPPYGSGCVGRLGPPITIVQNWIGPIIDVMKPEGIQKSTRISTGYIGGRPNKSASNPLPAAVVAFIVITSLLATAGIAIWAGPQIYNRYRSYTALPPGGINF